MPRDIRITRIEIESFIWDQHGEGLSPDGKTVYDPAAVTVRDGHALRIYTDAGVVGEYAQDRGSAAALESAARRIIGYNALARESINRELRGSPARAWVDIALWDLAARLADVPLYRLLGGDRRKLPAYASTINGANSGPLSDPESFADFAQECLEMGYRAFKIHPYPWPDLRTHIDTVLAVADRVGDRMDLMLDSFCLYKTFADALKVGRACDEGRYYWYEDPYDDGGVTTFSHARLREMIRTPLLQGEKVRTLQERMAFILQGATDFIRGDVRTMGISATLKLAHAAEAVGLDIEQHAPGPEVRHLMATTPNSNYYEVSWVHPDVPNWEPPIFKEGYTSGLRAIDRDGCVDVPEGPGLGVTYDWAYIAAHSQGKIVIEED